MELIPGYAHRGGGIATSVSGFFKAF